MAEKPAATFHPGTGPTPRTAVDVLLSHPYRPRVTDCGNARCHTNGQTPEQHARHQVDMLAAAGLLATAEHDDAVRLDYERRKALTPVVIENIQGTPAVAWLAKHDREVESRLLRRIVRDAYGSEVVALRHLTAHADRLDRIVAGEVP